MKSSLRAGAARRERRPDLPQGSIRSTVTEDLVAAVLGLTIVVALYFDGRAHVLGLPDSFFTPWHGFLYGGLLLLIVWLAVISRLAAARQGGARVAVIPAGYGHAIVGAGLFAVGGVADMLWHQVFGIEVGLDALLSPTHLLLFVGGGLLMSGPIRAFSVRADGGAPPTGIPATLAVVGITGIAAFALSFLSGFLDESATVTVERAPEGTVAHRMAESLAAAGLASYVVTSLILVVPLVYSMRARLAAVGTTTVLVTTIALLASVLENFRDLGIVAAALGAAALTDVVLLALRRLGVSERARERVLAALLPLLVWSGQLLLLDATRGVLWSLEMVTGVVIVSALAAFATVLALSTANPQPTASALR